MLMYDLGFDRLRSPAGLDPECNTEGQHPVPEKGRLCPVPGGGHGMRTRTRHCHASKRRQDRNWRKGNFLGYLFEKVNSLPFTNCI